MAMCGAFAGLAGSLDLLGWQFRIATNDILNSATSAWASSASPSPCSGRNTASGTVVAALLFGALLSGTLAAQPRPDDLRARAGHEPDADHPGPRRADRQRRRDRADDAAPRARAVQAPHAAPRRHARRRRRREHRGRHGRARRALCGPPRGLGRHRAGLRRRGSSRCRRRSCARRCRRSLIGLLGDDRRRVGDRRRREAPRLGRDRRRASSAARAPSPRRSRATDNLEDVVTWSALIAATLRFATPLIFGALGGIVSERSGVVNVGLEGMMLIGAFFGIFGADLLDSWFLGLLVGMAAGGAAGPRSRLLLDPAARRPDRQRHGAELPGPRDHRLRLPRPLRRPGHPRQHPARARRQHPGRQGPRRSSATRSATRTR